MSYFRGQLVPYYRETVFSALSRLFGDILVILLLAVACSPPPEPRSSVDTPQDHYLGGMQRLAQDNLAEAEEDFRRAIELDEDSPYGYTGMAFLELARSNYGDALSFADDALDRDSDFIDALAAKGRIHTVRKRGEDWFEDAMQPLARALEIDPENQQALHFTGECLLKARRYEEALSYFEKAAALEGRFAGDAEDRVDLTAEIITARPVTDAGARLVLADTVDRADMCVLLSGEVGIRRYLEDMRPDLYAALYDDSGNIDSELVQMPPDVTGRDTREPVYHVIQLRLGDLSVFHNGYFYPDRIINRSNLAMIIQGVMVLLTNDRTLDTRYMGGESPYVDVHPDYYAFNAVMLCSEHDILGPAADGRSFNPTAAVSGVDALKALRRMEEVLADMTAGN